MPEAQTQATNTEYHEQGNARSWDPVSVVDAAALLGMACTVKADNTYVFRTKSGILPMTCNGLKQAVAFIKGAGLRDYIVSHPELG